MKERDISKYKKILELVLELSNEDSQEYAMKVYHTNELKSITTNIIDRTLTRECSKIWVVASKDTIKKIDDWGQINENGDYPIGQEPYHPYAFQHEFTKLINDGCSLVIMTNHSDEYQIMPKKWEIKKPVFEKKFKTSLMLSDIYCYTYDDELGKAVNNLSKYINIYGYDIKKTPNDILTSRISELTEVKAKVLSKKY